MGCDGEGYRELDSAKHKVLFSYQHPNCTFAEYMVQLKDFSMKEAGISPDMLWRDLANYRGVENKLPLTEVDIEYLSTHEPPKPETDADGNEIRAFWYKTYMDAEVIHIFPPMYPENDESLIIYQTKIKLETQRNEDYYDEKEQR